MKLTIKNAAHCAALLRSRVSMRCKVASQPGRHHVRFALVLSIQDANDGDSMHHSSQTIVLTVDSENIRQAQATDRLKLAKVLQWCR
ncbi:hypothetical protein EMIT0194MI4_20412 [Pseudomonas sp. IT-194MI4]